MAGNSRLATAIHVAGMLSFAEEMPMTSDAIAASCGTNPVVIRRIVGQLTRSGLVSVKKGTGGGARLSRPPAEITLADIYEALDEGALFDVPQLELAHPCPVGRVVRPVLADYLGRAEKEMIGFLAGIRLAEVIDVVRGRLDCSGAAPASVPG